MCVTWHALLSATVARTRARGVVLRDEIDALCRGGCPVEDIRAAFQREGFDARVLSELEDVLRLTNA